MKVQELRSAMHGADATRLANALVEVYKLLPKAKKEEADGLILPIFRGEPRPAASPPKPEALSFPDLATEIETFLENAYAQNYFAPNRTVPKAQRSKWRFAVRRFLNELEKVPPDHPDYGKSADLYCQLYSVLCEGTRTWLFSSSDPFRSVGWEQGDLFARLARYVLQSGCTRENLLPLISLACRLGWSTTCWHGEIRDILADLLTDVEQKRLALETARELRLASGSLPCLSSHVERSHDVEDALCGLMMHLASQISEEAGLQEAKFFLEHNHKFDQEVALYVCLTCVTSTPLWIRVYEYGCSLGIQPRESLVKEYNQSLTGSGS